MPGLITLADARAHLRLEPDETEEDVAISGYILAATALVEKRTGHVALQREQSWTFPQWCRTMELRLRPVMAESITVSYLDANGEPLEHSDFRTAEIRGTMWLMPAIGTSWPRTGCFPDAITITATVGLGETEDAIAAAAPDDLKHAVRLAVGHWYANREAVNVGNIVTPMPLAFDALLQGHKLERV